MNTQKKSISKRLSAIFRIFLFVLATGLIVYFFPKEGKFKYEFSKGKPWAHGTLLAPFNVPIYKTEAEIQQETDSIMSEYRPYFQYDSTISFVQLKNFGDYFNQKWDMYLQNIDTTSSTYFRFEKNKVDYYNLIYELIGFVYSKGITTLIDTIDTSHDDCVIVVLINNIADEYDCQDIFTQKRAYEYITSNLYQQSLNNDNIKDNEIYNAFIKSLDIDTYIVPDLIYDEKKSNTVREDLIQQISLTRGVVLEKQRIISEGEVVNEEIFQILESFKKEYQHRIGDLNNFFPILGGQAILVFTSILLLFLFLLNFRREILENTLHTSFILFLFVLMVVIASLVVRSQSINIYVVPFVILPIVIRTFYDSRLALFIYIITILLIGFFAPNGYEFVFLSFIAGTVAIYSLTNLYRRGKLFLTAVLVVLSYSFVYFGMLIIQEGKLESINWDTFKWFGFNGILILTAYPLIYIFEKTFGFISDATLMELSDTNQPLLRKLAEEAPGTFQHSIQVANLAEEAIFQIGGNPLLVRAGALYHDIGKLEKPAFFVENQSSEINPHNNMKYNESAEIIIEHVNNGVELAKKHNLPKQITDFIVTHQGTTKVKYFYHAYLKKYPDKQADISKFTYPGPIPFSKETAVLMMADSVEAASRSLKKVTVKNIEDLVENVINYQQIEDQFNNADITFKDIATIKKVFKKKLENIHHARIEYPK